MSAAEGPLHEKSRPVVENALGWLQRSKRQRAIDEIPTDPSGAAWNFVRKETGIEFMNAAFSTRVSPDASQRLPVVELAGDEGATVALLSLAANFVIATRASRFVVSERSCAVDPVPRVIVLDSTHQITTKSLCRIVRCSLLRTLESNQAFESDLSDCLSRIHVCRVRSTGDWVPLLEVFRWRLSGAQHPTLVLWNGFLSDICTEATAVEVVRQLHRLVDLTPVVVVTTAGDTAACGHRCWRKLVTRQVQLDRVGETVDSVCHNFAAHVSGQRWQFSLSREGVFS